MTTYEYPDAKGRVLLRKMRYYKTPPSTRDIPFPAEQKRFLMEARSRVDRAWASPSGLRRKYPEAGDYFDGLLYGLPDLLDAMQDSRDQTLVITEGEKDRDSLAALNLSGVVGVSHWQGGSGPSYAQARRLRSWRGGVVVCADEDPAGLVVAFRWYRLLGEVGIPEGRIRVVRPAGEPVLGSGRDLTDHLDDGYPLDALVEVDVQKLARYAAKHEGMRLRGSGSAASVHTPTDQRGDGSPSRRRAAKQGGRLTGGALPSTRNPNRKKQVS